MAGQTIFGGETGEGALESMSELLAGTVGTASSIRLFKAGFNPTPLNVEADFVANEAAYTGYAAVPVVWSAVGTDAGGVASVASNRAFFQATDSVAPELIAGAWISTQTAVGPPAVNVALDYFTFPTPVPLSAALAWLAITVIKQGPVAPGYAVLET